ncbi:MAG: PEP/pyruvate-binding domain-containing protein [Sideroxyarcus sp.]|nr:PEP/pyruvate-binding domain-containing protein [Sideroxyarcus sp.]
MVWSSGSNNISQKALNIEILAANGITVPKGFTLAAEHYLTALAPLKTRIIAALSNPLQIREIFLASTIPQNAMRCLADKLALLPEVNRFAVRSSGVVMVHGTLIREESADVSMAGQFDSYLNVPRELVPQAVLRCWASLFNERSVLSFDANYDYVLGSAMSVLIQEMIPAKACAVMMTCNPISNGENGAIEFSLGPCEAIVSGIVNPDEVIFNRSNGEIISTRVGSKEWQICYSDFTATGNNVLRIAVAPEARARLSLTTNALTDLFVLGQKIERIFNYPQDVEVVITPGKQIVVTQSRSITTLPPERTTFNISESLCSHAISKK